MPRLNLWKSGTKTHDYRYTDKIASEYIKASGTSAFIYKYIGINDGEAPDVTKIQDVLFLENRDLKYDTTILELPTVYQVQEDDPDLRQFGIFYGLNGITLTFHYNDSVDLLGRKFMVGDVIELPHMRDTDLLNDKAYNKFYTIKNVTKPVDGFSSTWFNHLISVSCQPLHDQQESRDIVTRDAYDSYRLKETDTLKQIMSIEPKLMDINNKVVDQATAHTPHTNFDTQQYYVVPGSDDNDQYAWVFAGDGIPPNGAKLLVKSDTFPENAKIGDYVLRVDMQPPVLYKRKMKGRWHRVEIDFQRSADIFHRLVESFVFNDADTVLDSGRVMKQKQALSKIVPRIKE